MSTSPMSLLPNSNFSSNSSSAIALEITADDTSEAFQAVKEALETQGSSKEGNSRPDGTLPNNLSVMRQEFPELYSKLIEGFVRNHLIKWARKQNERFAERRREQNL